MRGAKPSFSDAVLETPPLSWCPAASRAVVLSEHREKGRKAPSPPLLGLQTPSLSLQEHPEQHRGTTTFLHRRGQKNTAVSHLTQVTHTHGCPEQAAPPQVPAQRVGMALL